MELQCLCVHRAYFDSGPNAPDSTEHGVLSDCLANDHYTNHKCERNEQQDTCEGTEVAQC